MTPYTITFKHLKGSRFEIGKQLGEYLYGIYGSDYIEQKLEERRQSYLYKKLGVTPVYTPEFIQKSFAIQHGILARIDPWLLEEMKGLAEGLHEDFAKVLVFQATFGSGTGCTHFFTNGYHARDYDHSPQYTDNCLFLVQPDNGYASAGFSAAFLGRLDGMNEKGLSVSLSFGAGYPTERIGIGASLYCRIILDVAATVAEAVALFESEPYDSPHILLVSDANGHAVALESSRGKKTVTYSHGGSIYRANRYLTPKLESEQLHHNPTTLWRENVLKQFLTSPKSEEDIMSLLTQDFPNGLFEPYYSWELGTLWSVIFDGKNKDIHLSLGEGHERKDFSFNLLQEMTKYTLPDTLSTVLHDVSLEERLGEYKM